MTGYLVSHNVAVIWQLLALLFLAWVVRGALGRS